MTEGRLGLTELLRPPDGTKRILVAGVIDAAADRGLGLALFLTAFPAIVPFLPPGASMVVGLLVIVVAVQMIGGARKVWLPRRIRNYVFSEKASESLLKKVQAWDSRLARFSHPRWAPMTGRVSTILVSLPVIGNGLILFLPLPFLNTLPALAIMAVGIGFVNRDGLLVAGGAVVCTALLGVAGFTPGLLTKGLHWLGL